MSRGNQDRYLLTNQLWRSLKIHHPVLWSSPAELGSSNLARTFHQHPSGLPHLYFVLLKGYTLLQTLQSLQSLQFNFFLNLAIQAAGRRLWSIRVFEREQRIEANFLQQAQAPLKVFLILTGKSNNHV